MSRLSDLKKCLTLTDLAYVLGIEPKLLAHRLHGIPDDKKYTTFEIPKKGGGTRRIFAPDSRLRFVQRRLATLLQDCLDEIERRAGHDTKCAYSHGFRRRRTIITNALRHRNRRWVLNLDLADFFPTVNFGRVQGYFIRNRNFELNPAVATVIAQIACHKGRLPQGSPCSPVISDLIASILDVHLGKAASKNHCTYTRYADDLTFSTNKREFPAALAKPDPARAHHWQAGDDVIASVVRSGFAINHSKTRLQYKDSRQEVTGLVANRIVNVPEEYYKITRAMCHSLFEYGTAFKPKKGHLNQAEPATLASIRGRLSHIYLVRSQKNKYRRIKSPKEMPNYYKMYGRFLDYVYFCANTDVTIMFEGETDITYFDSALLSLRNHYPSLISAGSARPDILYYRTSKTTRAVHHIDGGSGDFVRLIERYADMYAGFKAPKSGKPVIIFVDNDSGATELFKAVAKLTKKVVDGTKDFYHVCDNLYVVSTPPIGGNPTMIENFFKPATLSIPLSGKTFEPDQKKFNEATNYGKNYFAKHVVRPNRKTIDFGDFRPLIDRIVAVQKDYAARP